MRSQRRLGGEQLRPDEPWEAGDFIQAHKKPT